MASLAVELPAQQARVRELVTLYRSIGPNGEPAARMMEASLANAERAAASGNVVAMLQAWNDLQGYQA